MEEINLDLTENGGEFDLSALTTEELTDLLHEVAYELSRRIEPRE